MESTTENAAAPRSRARLIKFAIIALFVVLVLLWLDHRGHFDFRSDSAQILSVTEDFIEACQDRDFDEIWDLHSAAWQEKGMSEVRYEMGRAGVSYPKDLDDEDLFHHLLEDWAPSAEPTLNAVPWLWPTEWLADLRIGRVHIGPVVSHMNRKGQAEVKLTFSGRRYGGFEPGTVRLVFVREGRHWRIDWAEIKSWLVPEEAPPLPDIRTEKTGEGQGVLAARIGFEGASITLGRLIEELSRAPETTAVRLEVAEDVELGVLAPWLRVVAETSRSEVVLRPCRRHPRRRDVIIWVLALSLGSVWDAAEDSALEFPVMFPESIPEALVVLPVGEGGPPERPEKQSPGEMSFHTIPDETEPLGAQLAEALSGEDAPVPLFDPAAGTSIWKLGAIWRVIRESPSSSVLLALPGSEDARSRVLLRAR